MISYEQFLTEASKLDKDGLHVTVEDGHFRKSNYMKSNNKYLHDERNRIVTIDDKKTAEKIAKQYGGMVARMPIGTYRVYKK